MMRRSLSLSLLSSQTLLLLAAGCAPDASDSLNPLSSDSVAPSQSFQGSWLQSVRSGIELDQYKIQQSELGYSLSNPRQGYDASFQDGMNVQGDNWDFDLRVSAWGTDNALVPAGKGQARLGDCVASGQEDAEGNCLQRLDVRYEGMTEWYENLPAGLHQGFTISDPVQGDLLIQLSVDGADLEVVDADTALITTSEGEEFQYAGLSAWDANGRVLSARMEATENGLQLRVDTENAVWPIVVDPTLSTLEENTASAYFGSVVTIIGDANNDGYDDVVVAAPYMSNGQMKEGKVYLYAGSSTGAATTASWTAESNQVSGRLGSAIASGDFNNDGYVDLAIGAHVYDNGQTDEGRVFVYMGSSTGLATTAGWTAESNQASAYFGYSVAVGDINNDGYDDLVTSAYAYDNGQTNEGQAYVYNGSSTGLATSASWTVESNQAESRYGWSVAAGDFNGDGYDDVAVGAYYYDNGQTNEGSVFVYNGSSTGAATSSSWSAESNQANANFGYSIANAGDVNNDNYEEILIGAYLYDNGQTNEGRAYVYNGSSTGLSTSSSWTAESNQANAYFGYSVASLGDLDADGYDDIIVGAYAYDNGQTDEGRAYVYYGDSTGLSTSSGWTGESDQATAYYGANVGGGGDINNDGYNDFVVGSYLYDNGQTDEGRAYLYLADVVDDDGDGDGNATDCNDSNNTIYTGATETCDGVDQNCNGIIDDGAPGSTVFYADSDGDTYGNPSSSTTSCVAPSGYVSNNTDCNDAASTTHPGASELDNGVNDDCDSWTDEDFIATGDLVITEINRQPRIGGATTVSAAMWFEVYNKSTRAIDLSNWYVDRTSAIGTDRFTVDPASLVVVPAGDYAVFCASTTYQSSATSAYPLTCDYVWKDSTQVSTYVGTYKDNTFNLQRDTDDLRFWIEGDSSTGRKISEVHWYYDAVNGYWPRDARFSTSLDPAHLNETDNDTRTNWCSTTATAAGTVGNNTVYRWYDTTGTNNDEHGTPGAANYDCLP